MSHNIDDDFDNPSRRPTNDFTSQNKTIFDEDDLPTAFDEASDVTSRSSTTETRAIIRTGETDETREEPFAEPSHEEQHQSVLTRIPEALGAIGHNLRGTLERAIHTKDDYVVAVKVTPEAQNNLEQLVQAGVFRSRADAASYLIDEGIKAQTALFDRVRQKLSEIERLQSELRGMVDEKP